MSWIETIDPAEATDELKELFDGISSARGGVANIHRVSSLNAKAMRAHLEIYKAIVFQRSSLSRIQRERIAVIVSRENQCDYCVAHHAEALRQLGDDEVIVRALVAGETPAVLPSDEAALLQWVRTIATRPAGCSEGDVVKLREFGFDDRAILDASLTASYFCFVNRLVLSLGVNEEEDVAATCAPEMETGS